MKVKILQDCTFNVDGKNITFTKGSIINSSKKLTSIGQAMFLLGYAEIIEESKPTKKTLVKENKAVKSETLETKVSKVKKVVKK
ncbi:MAG: hypothetical protein L7U61_05580 [Flavobacteriaceae bacterium]|nr:hypothetical protein [Flavobacteriaceae bacterium]